MARKGTFLFPLHWAEAVEAFNRITRPSAAAVMLANHLKELNSFSLSLRVVRVVSSLFIYIFSWIEMGGLRRECVDDRVFCRYSNRDAVMPLSRRRVVQHISLPRLTISFSGRPWPFFYRSLRYATAKATRKRCFASSPRTVRVTSLIFDLWTANVLRNSHQANEELNDATKTLIELKLFFLSN